MTDHEQFPTEPHQNTSAEWLGAIGQPIDEARGRQVARTDIDNETVALEERRRELLEMLDQDPDPRVAADALNELEGINEALRDVLIERTDLPPK